MPRLAQSLAAVNLAKSLAQSLSTSEPEPEADEEQQPSGPDESDDNEE